MAEPTITCPKCRTEIKLTESLAAPLIEATRRQYESQLARERLQIAAEEERRARAVCAADQEQSSKQIRDLQEVLRAREEKLREAQEAQAEFVRKQRQLDDQKRELALTVEKQVSEGLDLVRAQARREAEESLSLKVLERDKKIADMTRELEEVKRKAEQGSQQMQGEVQELALEAMLRTKFPQDAIEPVPKGEHGGDAVQRVAGPSGCPCGAILWESKRTKNWSDGWLAKLREDQRSAKAELAVIVSQALPRGVDGFDLVDGVWVAHPRVFLPLALALRQSLIEAGLARKASEGQETKTGLVYAYLTGPNFKRRVEAIVEAFSSMREDLDREKKAISKSWEKRAKQIELVMQATVGMYGDLQGIAGKSLPEIETMELPALEARASGSGD